MLLQEGICHSDAALTPLHDATKDSSKPPEELPAEIELHAASFSEHAVLETRCTGFTRMPREDGDIVVFKLKNLATHGVLRPSVRQFMINGSTKAIEAMQPTVAEQHNSQIYTTSTPRVSVMKSMSCPDLMRKRSTHEIRCSERLESVSLGRAESPRHN